MFVFFRKTFITIIRVSKNLICNLTLTHKQFCTYPKGIGVFKFPHFSKFEA